TIPPVPVAAFGNQYLFEGESAGFIVCSRRLLRIKITRGREIVPGEIIFGRSDPDVEVRVDPGARGNGLELGEAGVALDGFRDGDRLDLRILADCIVETPQKLAPGARIVLPRVFAIENHRDNGIAS